MDVLVCMQHMALYCGYVCFGLALIYYKAFVFADLVFLPISLTPAIQQSCMQLRLHLYLEPVQDIVETAAKELKIETKLNKIEAIWAGLALEFVPFKDKVGVGTRAGCNDAICVIFLFFKAS